MSLHLPKINELSPGARKVFLSIIREFARDCGAANVLGLEGAEEAILQQIDRGKIILLYDKQRDILTLEVL